MTENHTTAVILSASALFAVATDAYERAKAVPEDSATRQHAVLTAVVFAVTTAEAFINETAEWATTLMPQPVEARAHAPALRAFADMLSATEHRHAAVTEKYLLASVALSGHPFATDKNPYRDFVRLVALRDALVHLKQLDEFAGPTAALAVIETLPPRIVRPHRGDEPTLVGLISTAEAAAWACNTTAALLVAITKMLPHSDFQRAIAREAQAFAKVR